MRNEFVTLRVGISEVFSRMLGMLTVPDLTLLFLGVVVSLGTAFVWMLWEIEQTSKPRRNSDRLG